MNTVQCKIYVQRIITCELCFLIVGFQNVCLYEMADAQSFYYFKDVLVIKVEHPVCKMW